MNLDRNKKLPLEIAGSIMNNYKPGQFQWHYEHGLLLQSIFLLGQIYKRDDLFMYVKSMYDEKITQDGKIISYREDEFNLDQINPGKTLFLLYAKFKEEKYRAAIEKLMDQLRSHPRTESGGFWHKKIYPFQMWLDGLYMQAPFYAMYTEKFAAAGEKEKYYNDIEHQFTLIESKARDADTGLLYHAWDESKKQKWADSQTGCSAHFWGRAMGWYCMALADVIEIFASGARDFSALAGIAKRLVISVLKFQDRKSGLWHQVLDRGEEAGNYAESSASSMFVYFLAKMYRLGIAADDEVKKSSVKGYEGLVKEKLTEDSAGLIHLTDICKVAGLGGNPYRDGSYEYYVGEPRAADDFKGVGPFILAGIEMEELGMRNVECGMRSEEC